MFAVNNRQMITNGVLIAGKVVGNVVSFVISGILCTCEFLSGWPLTFYGTGKFLVASGFKITQQSST